MGSRTARVLIGPGKPYDLVIICLLVAVAVLLSTYGVGGPLTWTLGFLAVFFAPGYALVSALFPGQRAILSQSFILRREEHLMDITFLERLALSVGLAAALMALAGTVLTRGILDLTALTVGLEAALFTYLFSALAIYRRSKLPMGDQFTLRMHPRVREQRLTVAEKGVSVAIAVALVTLVAVTATGLTTHPSPVPFSEFSITGGDGNMERLPRVLATDQQGLVKVTIVSHLGASSNFVLTLSLEQSPSASTSFDPGQPVTVAPGEARSIAVDLADGQSWEAVLAFLVPAPGEHTLFLSLDDGREVKQLWIPLTVT